MHPVYQFGEIIEKIEVLMVRMYDIKQLTAEPISKIIESWRNDLAEIRNFTRNCVSSLPEE